MKLEFKLMDFGERRFLSVYLVESTKMRLSPLENGILPLAGNKWNSCLDFQLVREFILHYNPLNLTPGWEEICCLTFYIGGQTLSFTLTIHHYSNLSFPYPNSLKIKYLTSFLSMLPLRASAGQVSPRSFIHPPHGSHPSSPKSHCYHSLRPENPKQTPFSALRLCFVWIPLLMVLCILLPKCFVSLLLDWFYLAAPLRLISDVCPHFQPTSVPSSFSLYSPYFPPLLSPKILWTHRLRLYMSLHLIDTNLTLFTLSCMLASSEGDGRKVHRVQFNPIFPLTFLCDHWSASRSAWHYYNEELCSVKF